MNKWVIPVASVVLSSLSAFFGAYLAVAVSLPGTVSRAGQSGGPQPSLNLPIGSQLASSPLDELQMADESGESPSTEAKLPEPRRLPASVPAASLENPGDRPTASPEELRSMVKQELPDAQPDEIDIWSQQLRDVSPDAAREILRLRRALDAPDRTSVRSSNPPSSFSSEKQIRFIDLQ